MLVLKTSLGFILWKRVGDLQVHNRPEDWTKRLYKHGESRLSYRDLRSLFALLSVCREYCNIFIVVGPLFTLEWIGPELCAQQTIRDLMVQWPGSTTFGFVKCFKLEVRVATLLHTILDVQKIELFDLAFHHPGNRRKGPHLLEGWGQKQLSAGDVSCKISFLCVFTFACFKVRYLTSSHSCCIFAKRLSNFFGPLCRLTLELLVIMFQCLLFRFWRHNGSAKTDVPSVKGICSSTLTKIKTILLWFTI